MTDDPLKWDPYAPKPVEPGSVCLRAAWFCAVLSLVAVPLTLGPAAIVLAALAAGWRRFGAALVVAVFAVVAMGAGLALSAKWDRALSKAIGASPCNSR